MNDLKELIVSILGIPYIDEATPVFDGSFTLSPYIADGLSGNGEVMSTTTKLYIELFYVDKFVLVENALKLWSEISKAKGMAIESPEYTYEANAQMWRASLQVELINKEAY